MSSELTPEIAAMMDKGFGSPSPAPDKAVPEAAAPVADTAGAPVEEPKVDASVIMMREDYTQKTMRLAEERRALEARAQQIAEYEALAQRLDDDPVFRAQFEAAMNGQATGQAPAPAGPDPYEQRIARLEMTLQQQQAKAHFDAADAAAERVAAEYGLTEPDKQAIVQSAIKAGVLHARTPVTAMYDVLAMAAARHVLPRAAANGQRQLLHQIQERGRAAAPVAERPAPPEPEPDVTKMSQSEYERYLVRVAEEAGRR